MGVIVKAERTYGLVAQGQFDVVAVSDALNHVLDHVVAQSDEECLDGEVVGRLERRFHLEAVLGKAQGEVHLGPRARVGGRWRRIGAADWERFGGRCGLD